MLTIHRRAALVLAASLVLVSGCEPLDNLLDAVGADGSADEPEVEAIEAIQENGEVAEPADEQASGAEGASDGADDGATGEPASEEPASEEPATGEPASEEPVTEELPAEEPATAPCTSDDTMLSADLPPEAKRIEEATGDLTGDGQSDEVITYAIGSDGAKTFYLRVITASGYVVERELEEAAEISPVQPLGAEPLGGDREVAFVLEALGASGFSVALFALHDRDDDPCALLPVTIADHTVPRQFTVGGTVGQSSGLGCDEVDGTPALTVTRAEQTADGDHDWTRFAYHWPDAGELQFATEETATIPDGDDLPGVGELDCGDITFP